ncbi:MAG TPA: hypothetical protein QGF58_20540 [Myxococcota bacterium]|nr:hypothetical protein [Myxococcota bacterium]
MVLALLLACAKDAPDAERWLELGAGLDSYATLDASDEVEIVLGPQGGYMIALALQAVGVEGGDPLDPTVPDNPRTTFQSYLPSQPDAIGSITVALGLTRVDDEVHELVGVWLIFNPELPLEDYFDQEIAVTVDIVDEAGSLHDEETVLAVWPGDSGL